jgi:mono/diheme cytochrome c family protein
MIIRSCKRPPQKGKLLYDTHCASCHGDNGEGFRNLIPPLTDPLYLKENMDEFACIVGYGIDKEIVVNGTRFSQPMAGIEALNPTQIANVANYVYERWSDTDKKFTPKEIETALANCK